LLQKAKNAQSKPLSVPCTAMQDKNLTLQLRHKIYSSKFVQSCSENCRYRQSAQKNKKKGGTVSKRILSTSHIITNHKKNQASTTGQLTIYNLQ
jgi:hypothetical protein